MEEFVSLLNQYISPELIFMIPFLMFVGSIIKKSKQIADTMIPTILCIIGIPIALLVSLVNQMYPMNAARFIIWLMSGIGQGIFLGTSSVGVHQLIRQKKKASELDMYEKMYEYELKRQELLDRGIIPKSFSEEVIVEGILGKDIVKTEEKVVDNINPKESSKNAVTVVGLNDDQMKYYIKTVGSKLNPRVVKFKKVSRL